MEGERKRERPEKGENSRPNDDRKKKKGRAAVEKEVAVEAAPPPTEEEVEEFFAILRRMREAVKYFEKGSSNSKAGRDGPRDPEAAADGAKVGGKKLVENRRLDLNALPDAESSLV